MAEFSNLLRQRLATRADAGIGADAHPDPDTLTAYMEQLLASPERGQVLRHLALCRDCREVVALSLPQHEEAAAAKAPAARRWGFLWSPRFGMAASLAVVTIVAVVVLQVRQEPLTRNEDTKSEAKNSGYVAPATPGDSNAERTGTAPATPDASRWQPPAIQPGAASAAANSNLARNDVAVTRAPSVVADKAPVRIASGKDFVTTLAGGTAFMANSTSSNASGYVNPGYFANNVSPDQATALAISELPPAPAPRGSSQPFQLGPTTANNISNFAKMPTENEGTQIMRSLAPPTSTSRFPTVLSALGPKARKVLTGRSAPPIFAGGSSFTNSAMIASPKPAAGEPMAAAASEKAESELDSSSAFRGRAMHDSSTAPQSFWRVAGGKLLKSTDAVNWSEGYPSSEGIEFAAFSSRGQDIWAGGNNAALRHSRDGGATWERVALGASANGTITHVDVRGALVQVKSSSGQGWSSHDGGKTWTLDE